MSHECKEVMEALKNTKAPPPGMLRTFLLAKALRDALQRLSASLARQRCPACCSCALVVDAERALCAARACRRMLRSTFLA